ncbi:DinB family protein [Cytobacillus sp. FJAT-54145]|uniref:DinB family protein n=1 Tax=Cytobacillus spartinae TaxID=3299023 RepID=A0ABW6KB10_9BACI
MNKEKIINEKSKLIDWVHSLEDISDDLWFKPFREGAWGTAEVISHFISWDKFVMENRLNYLLKDEAFPIVSVDINEINLEAAKYARSGISKLELVQEFITIRKELISLLVQLPAARFEQPFPGKESISLSDYFVGLIEHDVKHMEEINAHIRKFL